MLYIDTWSVVLLERVIFLPLIVFLIMWQVFYDLINKVLKNCESISTVYRLYFIKNIISLYKILILIPVKIETCDFVERKDIPYLVHSVIIISASTNLRLKRFSHIRMHIEEKVSPQIELNVWLCKELVIHIHLIYHGKNMTIYKNMTWPSSTFQI